MKKLLLVLLISPLFINHSTSSPREGNFVSADLGKVSQIKPSKWPVPTSQSVVVAVEPIVTAPIVEGVTNCGSDPYQILVYQRESGCKTNSVNSIGCTGIGQACPGSKLPCSLSDWDCQNNYFTSYMLARYGSWASAWQSEVSRGWW